MVSTTQMKTIIPKLNWEKAEPYIPYMTSVLPNFGIDTPLRKAHFLAQLAHESGGLKYATENLNYSAQALRSVFGKYFKTIEIAEAYARKPEKIANRVYADRMNNGNEASGDGWKYRGRGLIQLTGKDNYQNFAKDHGVDCVNNPDLILDPEIALNAACWYWTKRNINRYADADDIHMVTKKVNGGNNGILDRQHWLASFKNLYKVLETNTNR
ncbi:glycoside hydrolase family 19 protein [Subsaximicrobium wynnwilliamsii]|uniref:Glycoside hydrolase family 19 protein n=1 Tax=Subsaximicrobium wynnwilliamsii TaxID=291179 RepID=A0A5C6ZGI4_9FLAO|nr:glycoside hydrolase family 19 protein [Subsaximicrobium wynnwilliamsii]TXD83221.1 glycoside hydrolase family 19 protein [Subsaximicrobium wynnwilliamsii]TXD88333.1 glycoside hydrolase family 19 protein [Subsaximicrobium wynnwilliamsii]TXE03054.1 glycoside hydrolase family 19 protein [Subsaximicrobium wynnwilliamsii]